MYRRICILGLIVSLQVFAANAQEIKISSFLERDSALIGEQFEYIIEINSSESVHSFVPLDDNLFPPSMEVISEKTDSVITESSGKYRQRYLITSFDSGTYKINTIPVLVNRFTDLDTFFTESRNVVFHMPEVDTSAAIKDIKEPLNTPFSLKELLPYAPWAGGAIILVAIVLLIYFLFFRKKKEADLAVTSIPAHVKAIKSLNRIREEKLWKEGEVKEYYSQLSDTIRIYIEERFQIPAMESVTWEILENFKKYAWDDESLMELLESLLQLSDLVKFAKEDPAPSENETHLNNAYIFVEKTKNDTEISVETEEKV